MTAVQAQRGRSKRAAPPAAGPYTLKGLMISSIGSSIDQRTRLNFVGLETPMTPKRELSHFPFTLFFVLVFASRVLSC